MIAKTKFQKKVAAARKHLRPATEKQINWGLQNCFEPTGFLTKHKAFCLECGHQWKQEATLVATIGGCTCPSCDRNLKMKQTRDRTFGAVSYYAIATTIKGFQVVRMFYLTKNCKVGGLPEIGAVEVMQHWIAPNGKYCFYAKMVNTMGYGAYDRWIWSSKIELRNHDNWGATLRGSIIPEKVYPRIRVLPELTRNGFKGNCFDLSPFELFQRLLTDSKAETLLKANQISMLKYYFNNYTTQNVVDTNWKSIKICIRNGYTITKATTWIDYIELLSYFRKDLLSSHYVCPVDLKGSHDKLVKKKRDIERRARIQEMREKLKTSQISYQQQKGKFFGMMFDNGKITVKVLESTREIMEEGDELLHCVFTNAYYNKQDSLLLSARIDDKPIETIEVSLSNLKILQARGYDNLPTEHHSEIIDLVNRNMKMITARMKLIDQGLAVEK